MLSGNTVQVPIDIPVNVCGNTINAVGLLNPALGNRCANTSASPSSFSAATGARPGRHAGAPAIESGGPRRASPPVLGGAHARGGGARATGGSAGSPGVLSGNDVRLPVHLPVNVSGNSVNAVSALNPSFGNTAVNADNPPPPAHLPIPAPPSAGRPVTEPSAPAPAPVAAPPAPTLAETGADGIGWTAAGGLGVLLAGGVLYRRTARGRG